MDLAFGPVRFAARFDPGLGPELPERLRAACRPPDVVLYRPWPRYLLRELSVVPGSVAAGSGDPAYLDAPSGLRFRARGLEARFGDAAVQVTLDPALRPREMTDQLHLVLAAAASSAMAREELGVVLHASTSAQEGRAWTFPAPHATGKSTVARLLGVEKRLSDDLTALVTHPGEGVLAGGTNANTGGALSLAALLFLRRGPATCPGPRLGPGEALRAAVANTVLFPGSPRLAEKVMGLLADLVAAVPCHVLDFALHDLHPDRFRSLSWTT
ncbi:MAG: hypothetical protein FJ098_08070 [Deltaproteobacteria bacterium]|nr:hypothetical protein [Deltaproteobacteria bacterium]